MKKVNIINKILILLLLFIPFVVKAKEEVKVYLFWQIGCPHCEDAKKYFKELEVDYADNFELIEIEVSKSRSNSNLMSDVSKELNQNVTSVPYIVIGEKTFSGFYSGIEKEIKSSILGQFENQDNIDVVGKIIKDKKYDITEVSSSNAIIMMFLVIVLVGGAFFIFKKKK